LPLSSNAKTFGAVSTQSPLPMHLFLFTVTLTIETLRLHFHTVADIMRRDTAMSNAVAPAFILHL
jgi:hypothetical protein